jgi:alkylation response protein AidB-like acyl-CoA dehydrogenase
MRVDFRDTAEEAAFRTEAAGWLDEAMAELPSDLPTTQEERDDRAEQWQRILHRGNWAGMTWPAEYGGRGLSPVHEAIFFQEAARRNAPQPANLLGMILAGPTIMVHGTDDQKERFLPPILSGEEIWCQGFSEPGSGSDLASLSSRATPTEDGWVVSGQKVWNSFGHRAQRCMLLARTGASAAEDKHGGITYFLASMEQVEVRPLVMINGDADFNELFLDDVPVTDDEVLGGEGNGWRVALTTLAFERSSLAFTLQVETRHGVEALARLLVERGLDDDPRLVTELGRLHGQSEARRLSTTRAISALQAGGTPGPEGSTAKLTWGLLMQDLARVAMRVLGPDLHAPEHDYWRRLYLRARGKSVEGGTDEIQRSIVAERVLGLPKSR